MTVSYHGELFVYSVYKRQRLKRKLSDVQITQGGFQAHSPTSLSGSRGGQTRPVDRKFCMNIHDSPRARKYWTKISSFSGVIRPFPIKQCVSSVSETFYCSPNCLRFCLQHSGKYANVMLTGRLRINLTQCISITAVPKLCRSDGRGFRVDPCSRTNPFGLCSSWETTHGDLTLVLFTDKL